MAELDYMDARNAAWIAFYEWQAHQDAIRLSEFSKTGGAQDLVAEIREKVDLAAPQQKAHPSDS